ncbi:MAG TPA: heat-inducible transcription repressor HrcA [Elusimicrobia bacterium]|nr:MAG: heat-inducible transcription repressor HrcA [Elusimicrobia bacterium GWA2_66_18]HAZ07192.1 heat-inducible transcription repressor HrcA [Elusimicrobiota bacterium]
MRQLKPEVVERRKRHLLQWIVHYYVKTSRAVSSSLIAEEAGLDLSSASIRGILQELENEGYLHQPHTSAGREPTDKGYRFFVDYLSDVQRLAAGEKAQIEEQYESRIEELDTLLSETSRLLSRVSHGAGIVLSPQMRQQSIKRLELLPLGGRNVLGVLVTDSGLVRHWPISLTFAPSARQVNTLNRFLNESIRGCSVDQAQATVMTKLAQMEREFQELTGLAGELLTEVGRVVSPESIYVDGADNILSQAEQFGDLKTVQSLMRVMGEKSRLASLLEDELRLPRDAKKTSRVRIGAESGLPELRSASLVTHVYRHGDQVLGVLGILGSKRMEYSKMMGLVDYVSRLVEARLSEWDLEEVS